MASPFHLGGWLASDGIQSSRPTRLNTEALADFEGLLGLRRPWAHLGKQVCGLAGAGFLAGVRLRRCCWAKTVTGKGSTLTTDRSMWSADGSRLSTNRSTLTGECSPATDGRSTTTEFRSTAAENRPSLTENRSNLTDFWSNLAPSRSRLGQPSSRFRGY